MELRTYLALLRRWWWLFIVLMIIGAIIGYRRAPSSSETYEATTTLLISQSADQLPTTSSITEGQRLARTYEELLRTRSVMSQVAVNLGLETPPEALAGRIRTNTIPGTNLMELTVRDPDPQRAADIANEVVRVFIEQNQTALNNQYAQSKQELESEIEALEAELDTKRATVYQYDARIEQLRANISQSDGTNEGLQQQLADELAQRDELQSEIDQQQTRYQTLLRSFEDIRILEARSSNFMSVIEEALPGRPIRTPSRKQSGAMQGAVGGAVVAAAIAMAREYFRVTVKDGEGVERKLGVPTLALISEIKGNNPSDVLVTANKPRSPIAEAYRVLRTNIEFASPDDVRTIVVTSSGPAEGKSVTVANLATTMAQAGKRTILVDTDLRRPRLHKLFQQPNARGVTTALLRDDDSPLTEHILSTQTDNLYLMPSGPLPPNPADLLSSPRMRELVVQLSEYADVVIFDSPPVLAVADANLIARMCDAALLVVLAGSTRLDMLRKGKQQLEQSHAELLGVVLNRVSKSSGGDYYQYYYSQEAE